MSIKTLEVYECDCGCKVMQPFGPFPEGWIWGKEQTMIKRPDPTRRGEMIEVPSLSERHFASEACLKKYEKANHVKIERPVTNAAI